MGVLSRDHSDILRLLKFSDEISVYCHASPDGDTLGSGLALCLALRKLGKRTEVICSDPVPDIYTFLPGADGIKKPEDAAGYPLAVAVDCADIRRLSRAGQLFQSAAVTANVDHHATNDLYAGANWVETRAACGELIMQLIKGLEVDIDKDIAACLYTALMTDTGSFAYANTTPDTVIAAAELMRRGAEHAKINRRVYHTHPVERMKLHAYALQRLELYEGGRIAIAVVTDEELRLNGAKREHCEGLVESLRDIDTVELAVFLRQSSEGFKASIRAKQTADASRIASKMSGGGHRFAAGYTHAGADREQALIRARELAKEELELCMKA